MNETLIAIAVIVASFLVSYFDHSKSYLIEYVVISFVGYLVGRTQERVTSNKREVKKYAERNPPKS